MITFELNNVCPKFVSFDIYDDNLIFLKFDTGCDGCFKALYKLLINKNVNEVIEILNDCKCGFAKSSYSCLEQLAVLLQKYANKN
jgi:hypothetical protein